MINVLIDSCDVQLKNSLVDILSDFTVSVFDSIDGKSYTLIAANPHNSDSVDIAADTAAEPVSLVPAAPQEPVNEPIPDEEQIISVDVSLTEPKSGYLYIPNIGESVQYSYGKPCNTLYVTDIVNMDNTFAKFRISDKYVVCHISRMDDEHMYINVQVAFDDDPETFIGIEFKLDHDGEFHADLEGM